MRQAKLSPASTSQAAPSGRARAVVRETPLRRQWEQIKAAHPGCVLLFQLGDFFESFEDDARTVAEVCGVTLTSREFGKGDRVALAGVPITRLDPYLARLLEAGLRVAIAEQVSPPGGGLVERAVTRVVTPGTLVEPGLLRDKENRYLAAVVRGRNGFAVAHVDVSTGEFATTQLGGEDAAARLRAEIERLDPAEVLVPDGQALDLPTGTRVTHCQAWRYEEAGARERLCAHFGVLSLEGFGCGGLALAVGAAGAILAYVGEMSPRLLPSIASLRTYTPTAGMTLDGATRRNLEILRGARSGRVEGSLLSVLDRTRTAMGGRLLRAWLTQPLTDVAAIEARLDSVETLLRADERRRQTRALLARVGDLERLTARVAQGSAGPRDLLNLAESLRAAAALGHIEGGVDGSLDACPEVVELIGRAVAPPDSGRTIRPAYSPKLDELVASVGESRRWLADLERAERERTGVRSLKVGYNRVFGYYLEVTRPNLSLVPPHYQRKQTLAAAERFVTPDLKACEARILRAEERIEALERSVFSELLDQVAAAGPRLRRLARDLARLDVSAALAEVAGERGYCRPSLDTSETIEIDDGRHPVVEASLPPGSFIANDSRLDREGQPIVLLTGPNMAGKSTYLRQVALIVLLAQVGSFVPARAARVGVVDRIFTRVGAQDDLAAGASTFMVEMMEAAAILRHATPRSLIVLDEIGRGTSTYDGLAIARAVVEDLHHRLGARTLFATHFHELAALGTELPGVGVFNAAVVEEQGEIVFLRKIRPGGADRSYGIHVARLAGLPASVTHRAQVILHGLEEGPIRPFVGANGTAEHDGGSADGSAPLLDEVLALDLANVTPLEALNKLWEIQRRAGRR